MTSPMPHPAPAALGWAGILRLGLVQTALGAVVVLTTSAINRVMVVELALPASVPGLLIGLHYVVQVLRPRLGHGSDTAGRRTPWIAGGMAVLALGGVGAACAVALAEASVPLGLALAVLSFVLVGLGVGAAGTALLALLAARTDPGRRAAAASVVWIMMILGFVVTTAVAGRLLDPYSPARLVAVAAGVAGIALVLALLAVRGIEPRERAMPRAGQAPGAIPGTIPVAIPETAPAPALPFRAALAQVWAEPEARRFTVFVFVSMLAYSAQDLILEPFAGAVFGLTLGQTTQLSSVQHGGVLAGMVLVAVLGSLPGGKGRTAAAVTRGLAIGGCLLAAACLSVLSAGGLPGGALVPVCFLLGLGNGVFAAAAIGSMMQLAGGHGGARPARAGVRLGLWGAAQALAFGLGGLLGTLAADAGRWVLGSAAGGYALAFAGDAALFLASAVLAAGLRAGRAVPRQDGTGDTAGASLPAAARG